jgi:hypothetical protein
MKSYDLLVQSLYDGILADAGMKYPDLRKEFSRDYVRLCSALKSQGLSFFTITLPTAGKHLDKCLASGRLTPFLLSHLGPKWKGSPIPRLFGKLVLRVFERSGDLRIDTDILAVRILRQLFYVAKKLRLECTDERTFSTVEEFYQIDREVRRPSLDWDGDDLGSERAKALSTSDLISDIRSPEFLPLFPEIGNEEVTHLYPGVEEMLDKLQKVADLTVASDLGVFDPYAWKPKHGPGVVSDRRQGESKYDFPFWPRKLDNVFPMADFGFANFNCWVDAVREEDIVDRFSVNEKPSKLIAVPKTQKGPRLIAAEPAAHQWCQQILLDYFFTRVRNANSLLGISISFSDQSLNQKAALEASQTGEMMTVDLSSASDRVSCWLVERLFRRSETLLKGLHASRTRWISNEIDKKSPRTYVLRKFSCMGSACTFPVQSIIFWMIAVTSVLYTRREAVTIRSIRRAARLVRVFGDDIIVPTDAGEFLDLLTILGFKVNQSKTFLNGRFRESCGLDAFRGHDVTPTYVLSYPRKARPESITSAVESINNLVRGGWTQTALRVKSIVMKEMPHLRLPSLPIDSGYFGWKTPYWMDMGPSPKRRWNQFLHRAEILVHVVVTRVKKLPDRSGSRLLQYFTEAPSPMIKWVSGVALRPKVHLRPRWVPARQ